MNNSLVIKGIIVKLKTLFCLIIFILTSSCSHLFSSEIGKDAYWEKIVKSYNSSENFVSHLKTSEKNIAHQLELIKNDQVVVNLWGMSQNFDAGAKQIILDEKIIGDLQGNFKITNDNQTVHAGIMHTYGYLFSTLNTPYGYKRWRWTIPTFTEAMGLKDKSISPHPKTGTLLSNLTYFAGKIAFKSKDKLTALEKISNVSEEIKNFPYQNLEVVTLEEQITNSPKFNYFFRTNFIKILNKVTKNHQEDNDYLLIYSLVEPLTKEEKLITVFPIKKDAFLKSTDELLLGSNRPIFVRYNAAIGSSKEDRFEGSRVIIR